MSTPVRPFSRVVCALGLGPLLFWGCDVPGTTLVSTRTVQGAVTSTLSSEQLTALLATMALDLVGRVPFSCPAVSPSTPGAPAYTFDFGSGCAPNPALLLRETVGGKARVEVSSGTATVTYEQVVLRGVTLSGAATVTMTGSASQRSYRLSGRLTAVTDGKSYTLTFTDLAVTASTGAGGAVTLVLNGASTADDQKGTLSLSATGLTFADRSISGRATISASGGYFALAAELSFVPSTSGVTVNGSIGGVSFSFDYAF